ncbi:hypothetical protein GDO81_022595 [Engystomops pustulosus]|uniref:Murine leukemia virus integrase C-terminal domain-containing protein n=1 Tax=Engystomops pustulosus TaxID=76066 RepID=A0AAV6Z882_ENGPU|nr:hypothetical protein GDO81_022595 [Engystomops pustulosus]
MGLSPFEVLFGCAPRLGPYFPQTLEIMAGNQVEHATQLSQALEKVGKVFLIPFSDADRDLRMHNLKPGDYVVVKRHQRESLEPRYDGPFQVLLTSATSEARGKSACFHAFHAYLFFLLAGLV